MYKRVLSGQPATVVITQETPKNDDAAMVLISALAAKMNSNTKTSQPPTAPPAQPEPMQIVDKVMTILEERLAAYGSKAALPKASKDSTGTWNKNGYMSFVCRTRSLDPWLQPVQTVMQLPICMEVWEVAFDFWFLKIFLWFLGGAKVWVKKSFFMENLKMDTGQFFWLICAYCYKTMCKSSICSIWVCAKWVPKLWILSEKSKNFDKKATQIRASQIRVSQIRVSQIRGSQIRVSQIRVSEIRGSQIRASQIRASQIRATEISSNYHELHGAIFLWMKATVITLLTVFSIQTFSGHGSPGTIYSLFDTFGWGLGLGSGLGLALSMKLAHCLIFDCTHCIDCS